MSLPLKAPMPYFGGKSTIAASVWQRFGDVPNYVEPFFGSGAVLLGRPFSPKIETVNDKDPYVSNFFRALQAAPDEVAYYCDYPVIETDLHARHLWLVNQGDFRERMLADPDYYDSKIAGWWVWGLSAWIGSGWCDAGRYERNKDKTVQQIPELHGGRGVHRAHIRNPRPNLRPKQGVEGVPAQVPYMGTWREKMPGRIESQSLYNYLQALSDRLRRVRVCCGDWTRIMGKSVTWKIGVTAVFLDPPYSDKAERQNDIYAMDSEDIAHDVREWCLENGDNPLLRIALCGYDGEHNELEAAGWDVVSWKAQGGYGGQRKDGTNKNSGKERIWYSPHCLNPLDDIMNGKAGGFELDDMPLFANQQPEVEPNGIR